MKILYGRFAMGSLTLLMSGSILLQGEAKRQEPQFEKESRRSSGIYDMAGVSSFRKDSAKPQTAEANFLDSTGKKVGKATLKEQAGGGVLISFNLNGLPVGTHGIHIHETGTCTQPDFKSAGKHFSVGDKKHGKHNPQGPHAGDLGNIEVKEGGRAKASVKASEVTLSSLIRPGGTAIVIHAKTDDEKTDPSGNSGDRIACGVIQAGASRK